jgi:hypothetical protein
MRTRSVFFTVATELMNGRGGGNRSQTGFFLVAIDELTDEINTVRTYLGTCSLWMAIMCDLKFHGKTKCTHYIW